MKFGHYKIGYSDSGLTHNSPETWKLKTKLMRIFSFHSFDVERLQNICNLGKLFHQSPVGDA